MFTQRLMSGEASWRQAMELESRRKVIKEWLSSPDIPCQLAEVLQEMLATTERQLQELISQGLDDASSSRHREAL